jgi:hypothetical protein
MNNSPRGQAGPLLHLVRRCEAHTSLTANAASIPQRVCFESWRVMCGVGDPRLRKRANIRFGVYAATPPLMFGEVTWRTLRNGCLCWLASGAGEVGSRCSGVGELERLDKRASSFVSACRRDRVHVESLG